MRHAACGLVRVVAALASGCAGVKSESLELVYEGRQAIPNFVIDGKPARIHTQGLYVTDAHYYVTGRLETEPRESVFLRIVRADPTDVTHIKITPPVVDQQRLDHPGGFDFDGRAFWVPVSGSRPHSRTQVVRIPASPDKPLSATTWTTAFTVDDHIGALAYDRWRDRLYGANWDTKIIYVWKPDGTLIEKIPRSAVVADDPGWALAIQDFKCIGPDRIFAGGVDKRPVRDPSQSRAIVEVLDMAHRRSVSKLRLNSPPGTDVRLTHEGLARLGDTVFFLPGDLGNNATVFRYRSRE